MGKTRQSREERLEKKRIAEQKRKSKLKNNPEQHEKLKKEDRDRYHKNKVEKKILPIAQLPSQKRKILRERNRINSMRYRKRKKNTARIIENEELIDIENDNTSTEVQNPLTESSSPIRIQLRSKPPIENPKIPSVHISRLQQRVTRRQTEKTSTFSMRDLSMKETSQQSVSQPDEITINYSPEQPLVSSSLKRTTSSVLSSPFSYVMIVMSSVSFRNDGKKPAPKIYP